MSGKIYHPENKHPEEIQRDLAPDASKGLNHGQDGAPTAKRAGSEIKKLHEMLTDFSPQELRQLPVLCEGARLETKATYINLADPRPHEIQALGNEDVGPDDLYIDKKDVPYQLWNRILGHETAREVHRPK